MANLTAIYNTSCFFAYLFSVWLLRERIVLNKVIAVFLSLLGVGIITLVTRKLTKTEGESTDGGSKSSVSLVGDVLALVCAALYGFEEVIYKKYASPKVHSITFANTLTGLMGVATCTMLWVPLPVLHWTGHEVFELPTLNQFGSITLASKLNGGNNLSKPIISSANSNSSHPQYSNSNDPSRGKVNAQSTPSALASSGQRIRPLAEPQHATVAQPQEHTSRPSNPFAKGFSGLRADNPTCKLLSVENTAMSTKSSTNSPLNPPQQSNSCHNGAEQGAEHGVKATLAKATSEGDISFGADDFLMGSDELALVDLIDGLDQDKVDEDDLSLSWSPTPPKHGKQQAKTSNQNRRPAPTNDRTEISAEEKDQLFRSRGIPFGKDIRVPGANSTSPNSSIKKKMKAVAHGPVDSMFANGAWEEMLKDLRLPDYKPSTFSRFKGSAPMIELCLSDIEHRQDLHRGKVSGLVVMIKEVSLSEIDAAVTLLDPSGEMRGTIHRTVLEQYKNNEIKVGTVLALKNVSVFSPTPLSHYLIITLRNIMKIFLPHPPTIILSQGSSQERNSQKKRKLRPDSREAESVGDNPFAVGSDSVKAESSSSSSGVRSTSQDPASSASTHSSEESGLRHAHPKRSRNFSPELNEISRDLGNVQSSQNGGDTRNRRPSQLLSHEQQSQNETQEVQFQSLQQMSGGSSMDRRKFLHSGAAIDIAPTPIISLGGVTPDISAGTTGISSNSNSNSVRLLSSFAASPDLRKRSSHALSQKQTTISADSDSGSGGVGRGSILSELGPQLTTRSGSVSKSSGSKNSTRLRATETIPEIEIGRSYSTKSSSSTMGQHLDGLSSSDWPEDFVDDFDVSLDEGHPSSYSGFPEQGGLSVLDVISSSNLAVIHTSNPRQYHNTVEDDDDDDDLENLLDGLDENELFDLDS
ncbi:hypothetical protein BGX28_001967 [Mortierella sp. GBA30]|nr:hypothetical protein BGX28_001967 [Mortierella sp. GBA30]